MTTLDLRHNFRAAFRIALLLISSGIPAIRTRRDNGTLVDIEFPVTRGISTFRSNEDEE